MSRIWISKGTTLYHATLTKNVKNIKKMGLVPFQPTLWVDAYGRRQGQGQVFVFEQKLDAIGWAGHIGWEFFKKTATDDGKVSVLSIRSPRGDQWEVDTADPALQLSSTGLLLKRYETVPPSRITAVKKIYLKDMRAFVASDKSKKKPKGRLIEVEDEPEPEIVGMPKYPDTGFYMPKKAGEYVLWNVEDDEPVRRYCDTCEDDRVVEVHVWPMESSGYFNEAELCSACGAEI